MLYVRIFETRMIMIKKGFGVNLNEIDLRFDLI